jgi:hypothetical protein
MPCPFNACRGYLEQPLVLGSEPEHNLQQGLAIRTPCPRIICFARFHAESDPRKGVDEPALRLLLLVRGERLGVAPEMPALHGKRLKPLQDRPSRTPSYMPVSGTFTVCALWTRSDYFPIRPKRNPSSTSWLICGLEGERALPSAE